jgi:hypothetical protein
MKKLILGAAMLAAPLLVAMPAGAQDRGAMMAAMFPDPNGDGVTSKDEMVGAAATRFDQMDADKDGKLSEAEIVAFAEAGRYEETIAALATLCAVPVDVVDRLMNGERADPVLILARAAGFGWPTVRAVILSRPGPKPSREVLDAALENFERLTPATAQRVVRFWQVRQGTGE